MKIILTRTAHDGQDGQQWVILTVDEKKTDNDSPKQNKHEFQIVSSKRFCSLKIEE